MTDPSVHHCAIVFDGLVSLLGAGTTCSELYRFDPALGVWTTLASPGSAEDAAYFVVGVCLYVAGGFDHGARVLRYYVVADTWTPKLDMLQGWESFCAVTVGASGPVEEKQNIFEALLKEAVGEG
jgi:hypothetical protein